MFSFSYTSSNLRKITNTKVSQTQGYAALTYQISKRLRSFSIEIHFRQFLKVCKYIGFLTLFSFLLMRVAMSNSFYKFYMIFTSAKTAEPGLFIDVLIGS